MVVKFSAEIDSLLEDIVSETASSTSLDREIVRHHITQFMDSDGKVICDCKRKVDLKDAYISPSGYPYSKECNCYAIAVECF